MSQTSEIFDDLCKRTDGIIGDKYRLVEPVAMGGMGLVVKASHEMLERPVAIKLLREDLPDRENAALRFVTEARAAATIRSDFVGSVTDVDVLEDGTPYMVMDFLHGRDLATALAARRRQEVTVAVDLVMQALAGISAAHDLGVVHRDLKPANLFLVRQPDGSERLKVLDFGIVKVLDVEDNDSIAAMAHTTGSATLGTPAYMAPEQIDSPRTVDARCDIWALGLILYEMLCGGSPFVADTSGALIAAILTRPIVPPADREPRVPGALSEVVMQMLERDRDARVGSAREAMRRLAIHASSSVIALLAPTMGPLQASSEEPAPTRSSADDATVAATPETRTTMVASDHEAKPRVSRWWVVAAAAMGLGVAAAAAYETSGGVTPRAALAEPASASTAIESAAVAATLPTPPVTHATGSVRVEVSSPSHAPVVASAPRARPRRVAPAERLPKAPPPKAPPAAPSGPPRGVLDMRE